MPESVTPAEPRDELDPAAAALPEPVSTLANRVVSELREAIFEGRLKPGERIRQEDLAQQYGTSRLPVREALRTLDQEGLLTLIPHAAARVARLEPAEFDEIYRMRARLEPLALGESIARLADGQVHLLRRLVEEMDQAWQANDVARWQELDERFHSTAYSAAGMPQLLRLIEGWWKKTRPYRRVHVLYTHGHLRMDTTAAEHRLMLDAIERRDPSDGGRILAIQIERTRRAYADHPELFE